MTTLVRWLKSTEHFAAALIQTGDTFEDAWYREREDETGRFILASAATKWILEGNKGFDWLQQRVRTTTEDSWERAVYRTVAAHVMLQLGTTPVEWSGGDTTTPILSAWREAGSGGEHDGTTYDGMQVWCELCGHFHKHGGLASDDRFAMGRVIPYGGHCASDGTGWDDYQHKVCGWYPDGVPHDHRGWHVGCRCTNCREGRQLELNVKGMSGRRT